uniref:Uncharacterized protein n=1 Tax=Oryza punctata TaxID=4537 RepID=A0A0E0KF19_ORYPU
MTFLLTHSPDSSSSSLLPSAPRCEPASAGEKQASKHCLCVADTLPASFSYQSISERRLKVTDGTAEGIVASTTHGSGLLVWRVASAAPVVGQHREGRRALPASFSYQSISERRLKVTDGTAEGIVASTTHGSGLLVWRVASAAPVVGQHREGRRAVVASWTSKQ